MHLPATLSGRRSLAFVLIAPAALLWLGAALIAEGASAPVRVLMVAAPIAAYVATAFVYRWLLLGLALLNLAADTVLVVLTVSTHGVGSLPFAVVQTLVTGALPILAAILIVTIGAGRKQQPPTKRLTAAPR